MAGTARITIEVVDEGALAKFRELGRVSKESFRDIGAGGGSLRGFEQAAESARGAGEAARGFREIVHTLHPVLETAGLGLGNLGAFAAAARGGLIGLAAAITGAVLVGLEKLQDETAIAIQRFKDLGATKKDIEGLLPTARGLGVEPGELVQGAERTQRAQAATGGPQFVANPFGPKLQETGGLTGGERIAPIGDAIEQQKTLSQITQIGARDSATALKEYQAITADFAKNNALTQETIKTLSPGTARQLGNLFGLPQLAPGAGNPTPNQQLEQFAGRRGIPVQDVLGRVNEQQATVAKQFADLKTGPQLLSNAINDVVIALKGLAEKVGDVGLDTEIEKIAKAINQFTDTLENNPVVRYLAGPKVTPDKGGEGTAEKPYTGKVELPPTGFDVIKYLYSLPNPPPLASLPVGLTPSAPLTTVPPTATTAPGSFAAAVRQATATPPPPQVASVPGKEEFAPFRLAPVQPPAPEAGLLKPLDLGDTLATVSTELRTGAQTLKAGFDQALQAALSFAAQLRAVNLKPPEQGTGGGGGGGGDTGEGHAEGGIIRGPGTGTSDSIVASVAGGGKIRVSSGEGIVSTKGMARIGGKAGLDAINREGAASALRASRFNASGFVSDRPPLRFNIGGLVGEMGSTIGMRHLADGGVLSSPASSSALSSLSSSGPTHAVYVQLGDRAHGPMLATREVAENLVDHIEQQSVLYRLASGGRRSSAQS